MSSIVPIYEGGEESNTLKLIVGEKYDFRLQLFKSNGDEFDTTGYTLSALIYDESGTSRNNLLSGTITSSTGSINVTGTSSEFLDELKINSTLVSESQIIGKIATIPSDTSLTLSANANYTKSNKSFRTYPIINGTVSISSGSTAVTGTNTKFLNDCFVGGALYRATSNTFAGKITAIASDTSMTISAPNSHILGGVTNWEMICTPLNTGTITASNASTTITGIGTKFLSEVKVGDNFLSKFRLIIGVVASITSDTSLTFVSNSTTNITNDIFIIDSQMPIVTKDIEELGLVKINGIQHLQAGTRKLYISAVNGAVIKLFGPYKLSVGAL